MMASAGYSSGPTGVALQGVYMAGGPNVMNTGYVAGGVPTTIWNASPPIAGYTAGGAPIYQQAGGGAGYADPRKF